MSWMKPGAQCPLYSSRGENVKAGSFYCLHECVYNHGYSDSNRGILCC